MIEGITVQLCTCQAFHENIVREMTGKKCGNSSNYANLSKALPSLSLLQNFLKRLIRSVPCDT
jgi:hypothetical protein